MATPSPLPRRLALDPGAPGALWLSAMPGRFAPFEEFDAALARHRIGLVLCLTGPEEIAAKAPAYAAALQAGALRARWQAHAVEDFGVPAEADRFAAFLGAGAAALRAGDAVLLHCAAGIGRTGSAALCLLHLLGVPEAAAEARVTAAGSHPETAAQRAFVDRFRAAHPPAPPP